MDGFRKRFYTLPTFFHDLREVVAHMAEFRDSAHSRRVSQAFAEKIMYELLSVHP